MIPRDQIIGRMRQADFTFVGRGKRTELWRKRGSTLHVPVPLRDLYTPEEAAIILSQAKLSRPEIEEFLKSCLKH